MIRTIEEPGINGRIILKWILENWYRGMEWIGMGQDSGR
jgi:hypothetical protein